MEMDEKLLHIISLDSEEMCTSCKTPLLEGYVHVFQEKKYFCLNCNAKDWINNNVRPYSKKYLKNNIKRVKTILCPNQPSGCPKVIPVRQNEKHLQFCLFKLTACPFSLREGFQSLNIHCTWKGFADEFDSHFCKSHGDCIMKKPVFSTFEKNIIIGTMFKKYLFTLIVLYNGNKKYDVLVMSSIDPFLFRFELQVYSDDRKSSLFLRSNEIAPFQYYPTQLEHQAGLLQVNLSDFNSLDHPQNLTVRVKIAFRDRHFLQNPVLKDKYTKIMKKDICNDMKDQLNFKTLLLNKLRCPSCFEYMMPPIFTCLNGNSLCAICRPRTEETCHLCGYNDIHGRNITLEKLTALLNYPCFNRRLGCYFVDKPESLKEHEAECKIRAKKCFLGDSSYEGELRPMKEHIIIKHKSSLLTLNQAYAPSIGDNNSQLKCLFTHDEVFCFKYEENLLEEGLMKFFMGHLGFSTNAEYTYEVEFDGIGNNQVITYSKLSTPLSIFQSPSTENSIIVHKQQVQHCIVNTHLRYRLNLVRRNM